MNFLFDTSVLIEYLRDENGITADALFKASTVGKCYISLVSVMELYKPNRPRKEVDDEVQRICEISERLNMRIVYITRNAQREAIAVVKNYYSNLGNSCVPDALIISTGIKRKAYVVTRNDRSWSRTYSRVLTPEEVVKRF